MSNGSSFGWGPAWLSGVEKPAAFGVGDFNNDGRDDIVSYEASASRFKVGLSNGSSFGWGPVWLSGVEKPAAFGVGDFNNDGRDDIVSYEASASRFKVGLSNGSSFGWGPVWLSGVEKPAAFGVGDFNNDGRDDIVSYEASASRFKVGLSNGSSFGWGPVWLSGVEKPAAFGVGDFNNDGRDDIVSYEASASRFKVGLSNGSSFGWGPVWLSGVEKPAAFGVGDFNNDGRDDIVSYEASASRFKVGLSNGSSDGWGPAWLQCIENPAVFAVGDFNGDSSSGDSGGSSKRFVWPVTSTVSGTVQWHLGAESQRAIDLSAGGQPAIKAAHKGTVVYAGFDNPAGATCTVEGRSYPGGYGNVVTIRHDSGNTTYYTTYAHLSSISVSVGEAVSTSTTLGRMGSTGCSTGDHLHFQIATCTRVAYTATVTGKECSQWRGTEPSQGAQVTQGVDTGIDYPGLA
ncbi:MAG: FG-GAP-like repeat-containing protein [Microthrixaceae bacterium]